MVFDKRAWQRAYMRQYRKRVPKPGPPTDQHDAHLKAWFATLTVIERLDHRGFVRRCHVALRKRSNYPFS